LPDIFETRLGKKIKEQVSPQQRELIEKQQSSKKNSDNKVISASTRQTTPATTQSRDIYSTPIGKKIYERLPDQGKKIIDSKQEQDKGEKKVITGSWYDFKDKYGTRSLTPAPVKKKTTGIDDFLSGRMLQHEQIKTRQGEALETYKTVKETHESIDPKKIYFIRTESGRLIPRSGRLLKRETANQKQELTDYINELGSLSGNLGASILQMQRLPSDTKVVETQKGTQFIMPDNSLEWTRNELKKIERVQNPFIRGVAKYGFGAVSSFASLGKPIVEITTGAKLPHYISAWDYAFEPLGLSPKGSTEILSSDPALMAGAAAGEIGQIFAFHYAMKGVSAGIKAGVKFTVRKIPNVYDEALRVFSKRQVLESGRIIGQSRPERLVAKIGGTDFWKHMYGWSTGSLTKIRVLPMKGRPVTKIISKEGDLTISKTSTLYKGWGKTQWIPTDVAKHYKAGTKVISSHKLIDSTIGSGREQIFSKQITTKPKGMLWWKKVRTFNISAHEFQPFSVGAGSIADTWGGWVRPETQASILLTRKPIDVSMPNIWRDTTATATLIPRTQISHIGLTSGSMKHAGYLGGSLIKTIDSGFLKLPLSAAALTVGKTVSHGLVSKPETLSINISSLKPESIMNIKSDSRVSPAMRLDPFNISTVDSRMDQGIEQQIRKATASDTHSLLKQDIITQTLSRSVSSTMKPPSISTGHSRSMFMIYDEEFKNMMKKQLKMKPEKLDTKYHERTWKVADIENMLDIGKEFSKKMNKGVLKL